MKVAIKLIVSFLLTIALSISVVKASEKIWLESYDETITLAKKSNKKIAIYFSGSDWCKPCIKLKKFHLESTIFLLYANENLVLYQADFPAYKKIDKITKKVNEQLADKFNSNGVFPLLILLDVAQNEIGSIGYIDCTPEEYVNKLKSILEKQ